MSKHRFEAVVRHEPGLAVIDLLGEINALAEAKLTAAYTEAASQTSATIVLNFRQVQYINSTGIALMARLLIQARQTHRRLLSCGLHDQPLEMFKITRLTDFMTTVPASVVQGERSPCQEPETR
jgi:anti-sigma B factor antagonist